MASKEEIAADSAAVEDIRAKFGNAEAAKLAADLYKLRRNPPVASTFAGLPRWTIVLVVLWVAALETADKLPRLLLAYPAYEATLAEYQAKPGLMKAQLAKARSDAKAAEWQPLLTASNGLNVTGNNLAALPLELHGPLFSQLRSLIPAP